MIVGIDQSYTSTGVVCLTDDGHRILGSGIFSTGFGMTPAGLKHIVRQIGGYVVGMAHLQETYEQPCMIFIEGNSVAHSNSKSARGLAELAGALKYVLAKYNPRDVPISSWKSKIAKNQLRGIKKHTKAGEIKYLEIIAEITGNYFATTDEADAYCIAEYGRRYML